MPAMSLCLMSYTAPPEDLKWRANCETEWIVSTGCIHHSNIEFQTTNGATIFVHIGYNRGKTVLKYLEHYISESSLTLHALLLDFLHSGYLSLHLPEHMDSKYIALMLTKWPATTFQFHPILYGRTLSLTCFKVIPFSLSHPTPEEGRRRYELIQQQALLNGLPLLFRANTIRPKLPTSLQEEPALLQPKVQHSQLSSCLFFPDQSTTWTTTNDRWIILTPKDPTEMKIFKPLRLSSI